jgi:hypothetical protein
MIIPCAFSGGAKPRDIGTSRVETLIERTNLSASGIVAAGVKNHDLDAGGELHGRLDVVEADHLVAKADLVLELRVDWHQVVPASVLHAMPGIVEEDRVSPFSFARELRDRPVHLPLSNPIAFSASATSAASFGGLARAGVFL